LRRKYPRDLDGPKNEWKALIQHQAEINDQIILFEKELNHLRAKQLGQAYDQQLHDQIEEKEYQLNLKKKDAEIMKLRIKQFEMVTYKNFRESESNLSFRKSFKENSINRCYSECKLSITRLLLKISRR